MRARVQALLLIVGLGLACGTAAVAAAPGMGSQAAVSREALVEPVQFWGSTYCERLRRACEFKEFRGEVGEGNCRRYRTQCLGGSSYCQRLRRACIYKEDRGEEGQGNCRRYRAECGGFDWD